MTLDALDALAATTFATRDAAAAALAACGGDVGKARKRLHQRKGTPVDPAVGALVSRLVAAAKAQGAPQSKSAGPVQFVHLPLPRGLSALLFAGNHWCLRDVPLAGARLWAPGSTAADRRLRKDAVMTLHFGSLATGEDLVFRYDTPERHGFFAVDSSGGERALSSVEAILEEIVAGHPDLLTPTEGKKPAKKRRAAGPPVPTRGTQHRAYAGGEQLSASFPSMDRYHAMRCVLRLSKQRKLPADDLWLVTDDGVLFRLQMLTEVRRGSVGCAILPP